MRLTAHFTTTKFLIFSAFLRSGVLATIAPLVATQGGVDGPAKNELASGNHSSESTQA